MSAKGIAILIGKNLMSKQGCFGCVLLLFIQLFVTFEGKSQIERPEFLCLKGDTLVWRLPSSPCGPFIGLEIYYSENRNGPYVLIGMVTDPIISEFIHSPGAIPNRYYYLRSVHDCPGMFSMPSDTLDNRPPAAPRIHFVSVVNGEVHLSWEPSSSPQTRKYVVYRATPQGTIPIDTVENTTFYVDRSANPGQIVEFYYVLSMDACDTKSPFEQVHNTILPRVMIDTCLRTATIEWNHYQFWQEGVQRYHVFLSEDRLNERSVGTVEGNINTFQYEGLRDGIEYCFRIEAEENFTAHRASSASICFRAKVFTPVDILCLSGVNSLITGAYDLSWFINPDADLQSIHLMRSRSVNGPFELVQSFPTDRLGPFSFQDIIGSVTPGVYYYLIETLDSCGQVTRSATASNLLLSGTLLPGRVNQLVFNPWYHEDADLLSYELFRVDEGNNLRSIAILPFSASEFEDVIEGPATGQTRFCYQLSVRHSLHCDHEQMEIFSNVFCVDQNSVIVTPNAFRPDGINAIFKPVVLYSESIMQYQMQIFDRWGACIFETNDMGTGWDGSHKGKNLPMGMYSFIIRATQNNGRKIEEKGTLMLVR